MVTSAVGARQGRAPDRGLAGLGPLVGRDRYGSYPYAGWHRRDTGQSDGIQFPDRPDHHRAGLCASLVGSAQGRRQHLPHVVTVRETGTGIRDRNERYRFGGVYWPRCT